MNTLVASNSQQFFDRDRAIQYNTKIRQIIPGYSALHDMTAALLGVQMSKYANVLVVGSGTGMELVNLGRLHPHWRFTGVDPSTDMMTMARLALKEVNNPDRVTLHEGYVAELPVGEHFDAATVMLVMHFLPDDGAKLRLLQSVATRLKPGAILVLADLFGEPDSTREKEFSRSWKLYQLNRGRTPDEVETHAEERQAVIHLVPEDRILGLLRVAGFRDVERFYTAFSFGGWVAKFGGR